LKDKVRANGSGSHDWNSDSVVDDS
jgi:hypothetical protein